MQQNAPENSKKRSLNFLNAQEMGWKLNSKQDFITYFDQHRKYSFAFCLTPLQYSTTCLQKTSSTKIS